MRATELNRSETSCTWRVARRPRRCCSTRAGSTGSKPPASRWPTRRPRKSRKTNSTGGRSNWPSSWTAPSSTSTTVSRPRAPGRARIGLALYGHDQHVARSLPGHGRRNVQTIRLRMAAEFGCDARGVGPDARRQRVAADRPERDRPEARRRGDHDRTGLPPHADDMGPAHAARRHQSDASPVPCAGDSRTFSTGGSRRPSRRRRRSSISATSPT